MAQAVSVVLLIIFMLLTSLFVSSYKYLVAPPGSGIEGGYMSMSLGPVIVFFGLHMALYWSYRGLRGKDNVGTFTGSPINFLSLIVPCLIYLVGTLTRN